MFGQHKNCCVFNAAIEISTFVKIKSEFLKKVQTFRKKNGLIVLSIRKKIDTRCQTII